MARVANYAANQADNLVVARYLGANALGIYGRAYQLLVTPATLVGQGLDRVLFPVFASVKEDVGRLALAFCRGSAVAALITIPASVCLYLSAEELIWVVLGANWMPVVPPFKILVIGLLCRTSFKLSTCLARATAAVFQCGWRQVVYAAAIFAGATAGAHYGLQGVAAAVLAALILNHVLMTGLALRITGIGWGGYLLLHTPGITTGTIVWLSLQALASLGGPLAARPLTTLCLKIGVSAISALSGWLLIPQFALGSHGTRMVWLLREQARQTGLAAPATGGLMRRFARAGLTQH
jgi:PST family polysaccharide transporter